MPRIWLVGWQAGEVASRATVLRRAGFTVDTAPLSPAAVRTLRTAAGRESDRRPQDSPGDRPGGLQDRVGGCALVGAALHDAPGEVSMMGYGTMADRDAIEALLREQREASRAGDAARTAASFADDAHVITGEREGA